MSFIDKLKGYARDNDALSLSPYATISTKQPAQHKEKL